jgi:diaminopimelate decarboxylase
MNIAKHKTLAIQNAIKQGLLGDDRPLVALVNLQGLTHSVKDLLGAFPDHFRHCFAVKANPYQKVLKSLHLAGMGAEVASLPELELALKAGFKAGEIVFDAPVKTPQEIDRALHLGIAFNIDNFQELERVIKWFENNSSTSSIGFRINPQIGAGSVASTSTATMTSKFGIGIKDKGNREQLVEACKNHAWIDTIHVHVGSVGCPLDLMCKGIAVAMELADEINHETGTLQISKFDIGGGLPVDFSQDKDNPGFHEYVRALREAVPDLFDPKYHVTTEFGRAIIAKNAVTIGRVEYAKTMGGTPIALTHVGVQTLIRTVYEPENWRRRISAFNSTGETKNGTLIEQDIAGPACFSGDLIAKQRALPLLEQGDYIMVHDTGAYQFSNHYQYNALPRIPVYGYTIDNEERLNFESISQGQSTDDVIKDYS